MKGRKTGSGDDGVGFPVAWLLAELDKGRTGSDRNALWDMAIPVFVGLSSFMADAVASGQEGDKRSILPVDILVDA